MLTKLLKFEFKSSARTFGLVYLAILALCVVNGVLGYFNDSSVADMAQGIAITALTSVITAAFIVTLVICISRFRKGVFKDEGYLLNTLPVRPDQIITAKLIPAVVWTIATAVVTVVSLFVLFFILGTFTLPEVWEALGNFAWMIGQTSSWVDILLIVLEGLVTVLHFVLTIYVCISLSQLFQKAKAGIAVAIYFGLGIVQTQLESVIFSDYFFSPLLGSFFVETSGAVEPSVRLIGIGLRLAWSAVFWGATQFVLTKKLNLE